MIILRSPKGWSGPKTVDGLKTEGFWRAHQVPFTMDKPEHLGLLDDWLHSYRPDELFDADGRPVEAITSLSPRGDKRMGSQPARQRRQPDAAVADAGFPVVRRRRAQPRRSDRRGHRM